MIQIEQEHPPDGPAIESLLDRVFGADRFAKRCYSFRTGIAPIAELCLTAKDDGVLIGTIRYWPVLVGLTLPALLLGPIAVDNRNRCSGLGAELIRHSLRMARAAGYRPVMLVGDCAYYARFGFDLAPPIGVTMPGEDPARLQYLDLAAHPDYRGGPCASEPLALGDGIIRRREAAFTHDLSRRIYAAA